MKGRGEHSRRSSQISSRLHSIFQVEVANQLGLRRPKLFPNYHPHWN